MLNEEATEPGTAPFDPTDFVLGEQRRANASVISAQGADPEKAARSLELAQATGDHPEIIFGNLENYEEQHKAALTNQLLSNNKFLADYVNSDSMAAKVSHDDFGQLDATSEALMKMRMGVKAIHDKGYSSGSILTKAIEGFKEGAGEDPVGSWFISKASDEDFNKMMNDPVGRLGWSALSILQSPLEVGMRGIGGVVKGVAGGLGEWLHQVGAPDAGKRARQVGEAILDPALLMSIGLPNPLGFMHEVSMHNAILKDAIKIAKPYIDAGIEPPVGVHPVVDKIKTAQAELDLKNLDEVMKEAQASQTRERSPEMFASFIKQHTDSEIGISADAVREMYKDKQPDAEDGKLGWVPNLAEQLATAEATGGDIRIPLSDWLAKADPEIAKELHDDIRVRHDGLTLNEAKALPTQAMVEAYHGTPHDFEAFSLDKIGTGEGAQVYGHGLYFAENRGVAESYKIAGGAAEGNTLRVRINAEKEHFLDWDKPIEEQTAHVKKILGDIGFATDQTNPNFDAIRGQDVYRRIHSWDKPTAEASKTLREAGIPGIKYLDQGSRQPLMRQELQAVETATRNTQAEIDRVKAEVADNKDNSSMLPAFFERRQAHIADLERKLTSLDKQREAIGKYVKNATHNFVVFSDKDVEITHKNDQAVQAVRDSAALKPLLEAPSKADLEAFFGGTEREFSPTARGVVPSELDLEPHEIEVMNKVNSVLDRIIPQGIKTVGTRDLTIEDRPVKGIYQQYSDKLPLIAYALDPDTSVITARHEAIHHLRQQGFFKPEEWEVLKKAAVDEDWLGKHKIRERYGDKYNAGSLLEEAIADEYARWSKAPEPNTPVGKVFEKLKEILNSIKAGLKEVFGHEPTAEEIFVRIESGEVGGREGTKPLHPKAFRAQAEELESAEREIFAKAKAVGMTADQYKRYQKLIDKRNAEDAAYQLKKAEEVERRKQTKEWKDNYKATRDEVQNDIEARPDIAAATFFTEGRVQDANLNRRPKLDVVSLTEEQKAGLPKEMYDKDGINPDDIAGMFGYQTGKTMVDRLISLFSESETVSTGEIKAGKATWRNKDTDLPIDVINDTPQKGPDGRLYQHVRYNERDSYVPLDEIVQTRKITKEIPNIKEYVNKIVDEETNRRMEKRFGNLEENILEEAKDHVISQTQMDLLHEETVALGMQAGSEMPFTQADFKSWVNDRFSGLRVAEVSTDRFLKEAGKAGREAELALLKGDPAEAFKQKQRQYLAMLLGNEAKKFEKDVAKFDKTAKKYAPRDVKGTAPEYTNFIQDLLMRVGKPVRRSIQDVQEAILKDGYKFLDEFNNTKSADLRDLHIPEFLLDPNFRKSMDELTTQEASQVHNAIKAMDFNGRNELKIEKAGEAHDLKEVLQQMKDQMATLGDKEYPIDRRPSKIIETGKSWWWSGITVESMLNRLDRDNPRGIFNQYIVRQFTEASNYKDKLLKEYQGRIAEVGKIENIDRKIENNLFVDPLTGEAFPMRRRNVLGILQNAGNANNLKKLAEGYGLKPEQVMDWLHQNTAKEDWDRAQKIGDIFNDIFKLADDMSHRTSGVGIQKLELAPVTTPFGTYQGWYNPIKYDPLRPGKSKALLGPNVPEAEGYYRATTPQGYTNQRTGYIAPVELNMDIIPIRMKQMLHDIAVRPAVLEMSKVFYNPEFKKSMIKHFGQHQAEEMIPFLRDFANSSNFQSMSEYMGNSALEFFRQNTIGTLIGYNPSTVMKHGPTALINSLSEVGVVNFSRELNSLLSDDGSGKRNWTMAMEKSEELQRRMRNYSELISGHGSEINLKGAGTKFGDFREFMMHAGATPVSISDLLSAVPTWLAKYKDEITKRSNEGDAKFLADRAVRRAHGSSVLSNKPSIARTNALGAMFSSLYGFFSHMQQKQYELAWKAKDMMSDALGKGSGDIDPTTRHAPDLIKGLFSYIIAPAVIEELVTPTDDHGQKHSFGRKAAETLAMGVSSSFIGVRDFVRAVINVRDPQAGLIGTSLKAGTDIARDLRKGPQAVSKENAGNILKHTFALTGVLTGLTNAQEGRSAEYLWRYYHEQERPKGPWDISTGLRYGKTDKHSRTFEEWLKHH